MKETAMEAAERRALERERRRLLRRIAGVREFLRGSVVLMQRRCAYRGCRRCAAGGRHPTWVLTVSEGGKTQTRYLGAPRVAAARRLVANYRRLQAWIEAAARVNRRLLVGTAGAVRRGDDHGAAGQGARRISGLGRGVVRPDGGAGGAGERRDPG